MIKKTDIINYLNELIPNPRCELEYNKDYELLIATMLSAQSTDKRVNQVTKVLFEKYPTLESLNEASIDDIKEIIKSVGTFNVKANNIKDIVTKLLPYGYVVKNREILESMKGVGRKTANVVLSHIYNEPYFTVDTHVFRVSKRLGITNKEDDVVKTEEKLNAFFQNEDINKISSQILLFGRYYCTAKKPLCENCLFVKECKKDSL